jgi:hypothetical protein
MIGIQGARKRAKNGDGSEASVFRRLITMLAGLAVIAGSFGMLSAPANATGEVDNKDCPEGYFFIAKAELNDAGVYEFEGDANGVTISGDGDGGSFTSVTPVRALVIKGSTDREYIYYPPPGATSGDFTNDGLVTPSDNEPQISHVTFCGKDDPVKPDDKVEYGEWVDGNKDCESKTVTQTRTKSVTTYEWDGTKWVAQTPVVTTETRTRPMTEAELKECEPPVVVPPTCPNGTPWTDTNGNGMMDECNPPVVVVTPPVPPVVTPPEVTPPKMIKPRVKKLDKCELNNFLWIKPHKGYKAFDAKTGKRLPEGRYFKVGKKVIKVKFVALKGYELSGKKKIKVVFPNMQSCSPDVVTPPPTGMRLTAS